MTSQQYSEINDLRLFVIGQSALEKQSLINVFCDFIHSSDIQKTLITSEFSESVWYCYNYRNCKRESVVEKLYGWLVAKCKLDDQRAKFLVETALFVSGVDSSINDISAIIQIEENKENKRTLGKRFFKFVAVFVILATVGCVALLIKNHTNTDGVYTSLDLCRVYEGSIITPVENKSYKMTITANTNNRLDILVKNIYNPQDQSTYKCIIKNNELKLDNGLDLMIKRTGNNKITLDCDSKKYGQWFFVSK